MFCVFGGGLYCIIEDNVVFARLFVIKGMIMELGSERSLHLSLKFSVITL